MSAVELLDRPLGDQAVAISSGEADAAELLDACLARISDRDELNAVVATFPEESREMLRNAPQGPLHGVPIAIKDEWPLPWRAEQVGAPPGTVDTAPGESGPYRALRDAGAVIVGVANMHELGQSSTGALSVYGPARNPWDTSRCPGGSSSGSGSAVGGRLVAAAVGADGGGSIRYPASYCGVTGLKPTFARSALEGHHTVLTKTIVSGPLATDASGCRLLASALYREPLAGGEAKGLRIGVVRDSLWDDCTEGVRSACSAALEALVAETGSRVVELDALPGNELAGITYGLLGGTEDAFWLTPDKLNSLSPELSPIARALLKYRMLIPITLVERAKLVRTQIRRSLAEIFERVDVLAWPTVPAVAPPLEAPMVELPSGIYTADQANPRGVAFANLSGIPAISMPVGFDGGLPVGFQLAASWGRDQLLLDAAEALERATAREHVEAAPAIAA
jgi:Asp-tRNA(Asn)/Glu-tRNA(Gln) amidotransferase A subunit family amidase